jgi:mono/diheme cytochrome c family protein
MKTVLKTFFATLVFTLAVSTFSLAQGDGDLFKSKCAMCHGVDGKGDTNMGKSMGAPDLGSEKVQSQSDADLTNVITNGTKRRMPKYDGTLTQNQIGDLVKLIRTLKK